MNILLEKVETFGSAQSSTPCGRVAFLLDRIAPVNSDLAFLPAHGRDGIDAIVTPRSAQIENDKTIVVEVELPGVEADQVKVVNEGNTVVVTGTRSQPKAVEACRMQYQARIGVPGSANLANVEASFVNGLLTLRIPKQRGSDKKVDVRRK